MSLILPETVKFVSVNHGGPEAGVRMTECEAKCIEYDKDQPDVYVWLTVALTFPDDVVRAVSKRFPLHHMCSVMTILEESEWVDEETFQDYAGFPSGSYEDQ